VSSTLLPEKRLPAFGSLSLLLVLASLRAQEPLADALEACLAAATATEHETLLDALLRREGATGEALLQSLRQRPLQPRGDQRWVVPFLGDAIEVKVHVPTQRANDQPLPVLLAINWSSQPLHDAVYERVITADIPGYKPEQFRDAGRDAHMKVLRTVAFRAGGDPDALWFTGYSWGGHACWDDALHRPGVVRGIIARGGGPRRTAFRLLPNLGGVRVLSVCGGKDDPELVWNLREVMRGKKASGLQMEYWEPADSGHDQPLPGESEAGSALLATPAANALPQRHVLLADAANVEHPLFRVLEVDERRCAVPERVAVSARMSADEQRRATIRAMEKAVVSVSWDIAVVKGVKTITLKSQGVRAGQVMLREPWFAPGEHVRVVVGSRVVLDSQLAIDPRVLLAEAWRTGERLRPVLRLLAVRF
jgi:pimeloyl-ACP methyl ester carboxylesterase